MSKVLSVSDESNIHPHSVLEKRCYHRITHKTHIQHFGDGKHKFYIEFRCTNQAIEGKPMCMSCMIQSISKNQESRHYPHGRIYEPIPSHSYLFGGTWYEAGVKKWGEPSPSVVAFALRHQKEARMDLSKVESPPIRILMARPRRNPNAPKLVMEPSQTESNPSPSSEPLPPSEPLPSPELEISNEIPKVVPKKIRRPPAAKKVAVMEPMEPVESSTYPPSTSLPILTLFQPAQEQKEVQEQKQEQEQEQEPVPKKRGGRKKKSEVEAESKEEKEPKEPKKRTVKKKATHDKLVHPLPVVHKDSCIPTHKEESVEEQDLQDYEMEEVRLSIFILDGTVYFRDTKKNKLYRRIKEKTIGQYVGRYDPQTDSVVTDIPDSDDEDNE